MIDIKCPCGKFFAMCLGTLAAGDLYARCPHCGKPWRITVSFTRLVEESLPGGEAKHVEAEKQP